MPIDATVTELDVAEALLQLRGGGPSGSPAISNMPTLSPHIKMEIESAATLFMSCFTMPSAIPSTSAGHQSPVINDSPRYSISSQDDNSEINSQSSLDSPISYRWNKMSNQSSTKLRKVEPKRTPQRKPFNENGSSLPPINLSQKQKVTRDQGTQTEEDSVNVVTKLYAKIHSLENQLRASRATPSPPAELDPDVSSDVLQIQRYNRHSKSFNNKRSKKRNSSVFESTSLFARDTEVSDDEWRPVEHKHSKQSFRETPHSRGTDLVPIGEGYAMVPRRLLKQIDWNSYTGATRKLLTAVFSRSVLATHSLTGKPSPAFPGKPAKKRLEPELVNDIVQIVVERCNVPESVVRTSITTKCADESKMYRSRQQNQKKSESQKSDQENVPPSPYDDSSDE